MTAQAIAAGAGAIPAAYSMIQANQAAKVNQKAAKKIKKIGQAQVQQAGQLYGEQKPVLEQVRANQVGAIGEQQAANNRMIAAAQGANTAGYQPYMGLGTEGIAANSGITGRDPAASAAYLEAFQNSPLYQAQYQSMLAEGNKAISRSAAAGAGGGLNSGALLRGISENAGNVSNRLITQYQQQINDLIKQGFSATDAAARVRAGLTELGVTSGNQLTGNRLTAEGAYGTNYLGAGQNYIGNQNVGYGTQVGGQLLKAGAATGQAAANTQAVQGASAAIGGAAGQYFAPQASPYAASVDPYRGTMPNRMLTSRYTGTIGGGV